MRFPHGWLTKLRKRNPEFLRGRKIRNGVVLLHVTVKPWNRSETENKIHKKKSWFSVFSGSACTGFSSLSLLGNSGNQLLYIIVFVKRVKADGKAGLLICPNKIKRWDFLGGQRKTIWEGEKIKKEKFS